MKDRLSVWIEVVLGRLGEERECKSESEKHRDRCTWMAKHGIGAGQVRCARVLESVHPSFDICEQLQSGLLWCFRLDSDGVYVLFLDLPLAMTWFTLSRLDGIAVSVQVETKVAAVNVSV
jgi:hypothetical protein